MNDQGDINLALHRDKAYFCESISYTAAETAFPARLIEKDYFCSVVLAYLSKSDPYCVFKGGTCLAKVHLGFYRLSEDLDFVIPMPVGSARSQRSKQAGAFKQAMAGIDQELDCIHISKPLQGANNSTQYNAVLRYQSLLNGGEETIKAEVSLRESLVQPAVLGQARTLLLDPISSEPLIPTVSTNCISITEAMAEKCRAALTRREIAIRDFYDLAYTVKKCGLDTRDPKFLALLKAKLAIPGNGEIRLGPDRATYLNTQLVTRLKPVLREKDFTEFDLEAAFAMVCEVADFILE